jgi:2-oxoglutarate ferredoxin oxidoreductase subunit beta
VLHLRELERSIAEALNKPGFSFIEVLSPCPTVYGRLNKLPRALDEMHSYQERSIIRDGADPKDVEISVNGPIVVGKFVDIERPTLWDCYQQMLGRASKPKKR